MHVQLGGTDQLDDPADPVDPVGVGIGKQRITAKVHVGTAEQRAAVSYTHLDVYKRQAYGEAPPFKCKSTIFKLLFNKQIQNPSSGYLIT